MYGISLLKSALPVSRNAGFVACFHFDLFANFSGNAREGLIVNSVVKCPEMGTRKELVKLGAGGSKLALKMTRLAPVACYSSPGNHSDLQILFQKRVANRGGMKANPRLFPARDWLC